MSFQIVAQRQIGDLEASTGATTGSPLSLV